MTLNLGLLATATQILADSDEGGGSIAPLFLLAGFIFYGFMYLKYRNINKRHKHESETEATLHNMRADDQFNKSLKGLSESRMAGANNHDVRAGNSTSAVFGRLLKKTTGLG